MGGCASARHPGSPARAARWRRSPVPGCRRPPRRETLLRKRTRHGARLQRVRLRGPLLQGALLQGALLRGALRPAGRSSSSTWARRIRPRTGCCGCGSPSDGDRITAAEPEIGFMHRGAEKLFEARDYRQIIVLANRHDWLGAFANELGVVLAAERLAGIEVPPRAVWARTMLAELNRVLSHLLSSAPTRRRSSARSTAGVVHALPASGGIQSVMEEISGGRMHYMFNRVGGLKEEIPAGWLARARAAHRRGARGAARDRGRRRPGRIFRARTRGIGVLTRGQVRQYGVSGPAARASGVDLDLRRDEPYLAYGELAGLLRVRSAPRGTAWPASSACCDQARGLPGPGRGVRRTARQLPSGPAQRRLPKVFKVPEGHAYAWTEGPARAERLLPGLPGRQDAVAAQAAVGVVQQRGGAPGSAAGAPDHGPGRDPGLPVLRRR